MVRKNYAQEAVKGRQTLQNVLIYFALRDVAQLGRALRSGRKGRRFESCHPDQKTSKPREKRGFEVFDMVGGFEPEKARA